MKTGLVSVSFRSHSPEDIIEAAAAAKLGGIEWGGDVHVPCGDLNTASTVSRKTLDAGLEIFAYGSYYWLGTGKDVRSAFYDVLQTAQALHAPIIRLWAYNKGSNDITEPEWEMLVSEATLISDMAKDFGIILSFECHNGTLTDDYHATLRFLNEIGRDNITMYWQPNQYRSEAYNLEAARALAPFVTNIHTFHWDANQHYPLAEGQEIWNKYISIFHENNNHAFLLEFMHDNSIESLPETAKTLISWLNR